MAEFDRIQPGDVVVCPTTVAAWSPIFGSIAALVTEHGGPLSHPATLAREYGLPAVLAVENATSRLEDGQRVRIDGGAGIVEPI
jgi:pyruvate,water dikinase